MTFQPSEPTQRYARLAQRAQRDGRIPALAVALHRADRPLWHHEIGAEPDTQFRIGSVTKTFTAALVMRCRDDGLLDLDDPVGRHVDLPAHGELPIRRLLSHTSGLQREPFGDVWDSMRAPDTQALLADLARAERVLPPARRFHYSNLSVAILGYLVGRLRGGTWEEVLADEILGPLGLSGTTVRPTDRAATGYLVDAYSDEARPEPSTDFGAVGPAAQLWGTASDLARWAAFLADPAAMDPDGRVLRPATLDEMRWPLTVTDETQWGIGYGLGLILVPRGERIMHVGHDGAMPGFLAGVYGRRGKDAPPACGVAVLGASGTATETLTLPHALLAEAAEHDPVEIKPWRPGAPAPERFRSALGHWWGEGSEYVFSWHEGALRARGAGDESGRPPAIFEELEPDLLRTVSGREVGELLRLTRDPATGAVIRMHWATYRFTRDQQTFGS
ncbi:serine hydrolase domain-containing protein [Rugosimonospora acidiphila]|uniref:Serine hydrolase domain-containing protein n=1 Tax=Rugosimonospora acidiphila TaxID=556531 RepID=A0ABP9RRW4_9ACTN